MNFKESGIFLRDHETPKNINNLIKAHARVLVIDDKCKKSMDYENIADFRSNKAHDYRVKQRMVISRYQFFFLVRKGLIQCNYDVIIFYAQKLDPLDFSTFKMFLFDQERNEANYKVFAFLDEILELDSVYLQARRFDRQVEENPIEANVRIIICKPKIHPQHKTYLQLKKLLNYEDPENLDEISYKPVFSRLISKMKEKSEIAQKASDYKHMEVDQKALSRINLTESKLKILYQLIEKNRDKRVYVVCKRKILLNFLKFFNEYEDDLDLIIYYDLIDSNKLAKNVTILMGKDENLEKVIEIQRKYENRQQHKFFQYLYQKEEIFTLESGAFIEKRFSNIMLDRIFSEFKYMFEEHFLFLSFLGYTKNFMVKDNLFRCYVDLPKISSDPVFTSIHMSRDHKSKKEACQDVCFEILKKLKSQNCLNDNFSPNAEYFIISDFYKTLLHATYKFDVSLFENFDIEYFRNIQRIHGMPLSYYLQITESNFDADSPKNENKETEEDQTTFINKLFELESAPENPDMHQNKEDEKCDTESNNLRENDEDDSSSEKQSLLSNTLDNQSFGSEYTFNRENSQKKIQSSATSGKQVLSFRKNVRYRPKYVNKVMNWLFLLLFKFASNNPNIRLKAAFKHKYMVLFNKPEADKTIKTNNVPKCFQENDYSHLYQLKYDNYEIGIICGKTFDCFECEKSKFEYIGKHSLSEIELQKIILYNTIFFGLACNKKGNLSAHHYFMVPLKNKVPDIKPLFGSFYENQHQTDRALFNPCNRSFYSFHEWSDVSLHDIFVPAFDYSKKYHNQTKNTIIEANEQKKIQDLSEIDKISDDESSNDSGIDINDEDIFTPDESEKPKEKCTYLEFYENKYAIKMKHTEKDLKNVICVGFPFTTRKTKTPNTSLLSSEILQITPFTTKISEEFQKFKLLLIQFGIVALANEAKNVLKLPIPLSSLYQCFIPKNTYFHNYEKLEFLGDTILKFLITKYFLVYFDYDIGTLVDKKCRIIENINLSKVGSKLSLESYLSDLSFNIPSATPLASYFRNYFRFNNCNPRSNDHIFNNKTLADVLEAIIGACYLHNGLNRTELLLFDLKIIDSEEIKDEKSEEIDQTKENIENTNVIDENTFFSDQNTTTIKQSNPTIAELYNDNSPFNQFFMDQSILDEELTKVLKNNTKQPKIIGEESYDEMNTSHSENKVFHPYITKFNKIFHKNEYIKSVSLYNGIMSAENIKKVENILNYKFQNRGYLEKAMIHPSTRNNIFGNRIYFEKLELIGDSLLDVFVTRKLYKEHHCNDCKTKEFTFEKKVEESNQNYCAYQLHELKKELVNNQIYGNVLFNSNLYIFIETCFSKEELNDEYLLNKYKKIWGDIFEAINGAILLDLGYDMQKYEKVWKKTIKKWLFDCYERRKEI